MREFGQHINIHLDRLEQPQRRGPIHNQNPNPNDEYVDNESMPSLEGNDHLQNTIPRRHVPLLQVHHRKQNKDIKLVVCRDQNRSRQNVWKLQQ